MERQQIGNSVKNFIQQIAKTIYPIETSYRMIQIYGLH